MSLVLDEHRAYIADGVRVAAFERAIAQTVRQGDVVIDLGSGTGILGLLAARAGASRVYAVEETALSGLAREIAAANGAADRIRVVRGWSSWITLPERADVVITDQIGHFGIEAGLFEYVPDARARLLKDAGRTVPCAITWRVAPVECLPLREAIDFWRRPHAGFDFTPIARPAGCSGFNAMLEREALLAPAVNLARHEVCGLPESGLVSGEVAATIDRRGTVDGLAGWFVAELAPGVTFTNGPDADQRINRRQVVLPIAPTSVSPGDVVRARVRFRPTTLMVEWDVLVADAHGVERSHTRRSTFEGMLIAPEDMIRTLPTARPTLSRLGLARRRALALCDGTRTRNEIEDVLRREFSDTLGSRDAAAAFVSEVLSGDAT